GPGVDVALLTGWEYGRGLDGLGFGGRDIRGWRVGLAQHVLEGDGLGVLRAQLERLGNGRERVAHIAAACQRNGEVELVVGIVRVADDGFLKEGSTIMASTRCRYSLVIYHFRQRKLSGDKGEGLFRIVIVAGVEEGESAVELGLQS